MLKCTPSRYTIRQCSCSGRARQVSNCWVSVWLRRLIVLATSRDSHERLSHFSDFVRADSGHKHLAKSLRHLRFIATVAVEDLGVELPLPVSGNLDLLD